MPTYEGSCHCGAVKFEIDAEFERFMRCDCSICRRKAALIGKVHESKLHILEGEENLTLYEWNSRAAKHYFCKTCGIHPFNRMRSAPDHYGVNMNCFDEDVIAGIPVVPVDGKSMPLVEA